MDNGTNAIFGYAICGAIRNGTNDVTYAISNQKTGTLRYSIGKFYRYRMRSYLMSLCSLPDIRANALSAGELLLWLDMAGCNNKLQNAVSFGRVN